ncbi:hypothetical protein K438DRAFT_382555 [Mycena galopus ATCC 62051]|nr:hypothetical protein K438DRAFT_382555 [Mycena galopus ATCC 62051]
MRYQTTLAQLLAVSGSIPRVRICSISLIFFFLIPTFSPNSRTLRSFLGYILNPYTNNDYTVMGGIVITPMLPSSSFSLVASTPYSLQITGLHAPRPKNQSRCGWRCGQGDIETGRRRWKSPALSSLIRTSIGFDTEHARCERSNEIPSFAKAQRSGSPR